MTEEIEEKNFEIVEVEFKKRELVDIINDAETIDTVRIGKEVLTWIADNVESFVDSESTIFKLDLVLDETESMSEVKRLQDLYRAIPDDESTTVEGMGKAIECRKVLDAISEKVFKTIGEESDLLDHLFKRLIFFYEKLIPSPQKKIKADEIDAKLRTLILSKEEAPEEDREKIQELINEQIGEGLKLLKYEEMEGCVKVIRFEYEAFSVGVRVSEGSMDIKPREDRAVSKEYIIPEGLTCWIELAYQIKKRQASLF